MRKIIPSEAAGRGGYVGADVMVRSAIFSWALVLLLAGLGGHALQFPVFAQAAIEFNMPEEQTN